MSIPKTTCGNTDGAVHPEYRAQRCARGTRPKNLRLFRTGAIPEAHRFGVWHEVVNGWLPGVEANPVCDAPFHVSGCLHALPELRGVFDGTIKRTRAVVSKDNDDLFLFVNSGGAFAASQRGRETEIGVGGYYLMSCTEVGAYRRPEGMKLTVVPTRQDPVSAIVRNVYDGLGRALAPHNEGLCLLIRYLHILHDAEPIATAEARALVTRHVQDLLALALGAAGEARELANARGLRAARLKAVQAHIEQNLDRPEFSPDVVALRFRISERTLQRLFEAKGTSFSEYLLGRRLERVHATLGDLRGDARSISDIALACGFGNISYFNRQFRARYGATPSDIRNRDILQEARPNGSARDLSP